MKTQELPRGPMQRPQMPQPQNLKPMFNNAVLTEEQIAELKDYVATRFHAKLYRSVICGKTIYWRGMSRYEYKALVDEMDSMGQNTTIFDTQDYVCQKIIMHPTLGIEPGMLDTRSCEAGLFSQLFEHFMEKMGFTRSIIEPVEL